MNISSIILVVNSKLEIEFVNTAFVKLVKRRREDFIGKPIKEMIQLLDGHWEFIMNELSSHIKKAEKEIRKEARKKDSHSRLTRDPLCAQTSHVTDVHPPSAITLNDRIFTYQIFDAGKTSSGHQNMGLLLNDLTNERNFLDRMSQAENIASLKTLAAGISHEISNPLHSILCFSEAISDEKDLGKIKNYAEKIKDNSKRLAKAVADFSGYVQRKGNGIRKEVNLKENIKAAIRFAMLAYNEDKIELETDLHPFSLFDADPEEIQKIFINVLNNALQAMDGEGKLKILTYDKKDYFWVEIKDSGPGIPDEYLKNVFNPFFTTKMQGEGTGLGLSITQSLVEKYNGKIKIKSSQGNGTVVSLCFPKNSSPA
jgi:signal transduction histidine kinase